MGASNGWEPIPAVGCWTAFRAHLKRRNLNRAEIQDSVQVIEKWNSANDFILYGKGGNSRATGGKTKSFAMINVRTLSGVTRRDNFRAGGGAPVRRVTSDRVAGRKPPADAQRISTSSDRYDSGSNYGGVDDNRTIDVDEGGSATTGYIPDSNRGVTIAGGFDLGVHTASD
jgi:hypothetical protein